MPNPLFFRIHSATAGVLDMSRSGEEIDAAVNRADGVGASGVVLVGDDFEHMFLRESLGALLMTQLTIK